MESPVNEAQRQFLLGMAGVRVWYARTPLPGAAPSPVFRFPEPQVEENFADVVPESKAVQGQAADRRFARPQRERMDPAAAERGAKRIAGLQQLISGHGEKARPTAKDAKVSVAPESATDVHAQAGATPPGPASGVALGGGPVSEPFSGYGGASPSEAADTATVSGRGRADTSRIEGHWGIWRAGHWCLVSELATGASRALEYRLAVAILAALRDELVEHRELRWPVFAHPELPGGGVEGFTDTLQRLGKDLQLADGKPGRILLLNSHQRSASIPVGPEPMAALLETAWGVPVCRFQGSLAALAGDPALKRSLWALLRPLISAGQE